MDVFEKTIKRDLKGVSEVFDTIEEALAELQKGHVIIVCDDEDRENEGDFVALAQYATPEVINFMAKEGRGLICVPVSEALANKLDLRPMTITNTDTHQTAFTISVDHIDTTTGISAYERSLTIRNMLHAQATAKHFKRPGHVFPLVAKSGGVIQRPGHTEAAVDLAKLCGAKEAGVICEIMNDDGTMARVPQLKEMANKYNLKMITIQDLIRYRVMNESFVKREAEIQLPCKFGSFKAIGYTNKLDGKEHIAIVKGQMTEHEPILVRVHSECLTGDVFGSNRCDCGPQLEAALAQIEQVGRGVLLYMRQEGRGIGLINKLKAYELQEQGFDTVEANHKLGFQADERDYTIAAHILHDLGVKQLKLLTNNPRKITSLEGFGFNVVERVPIQMPSKVENQFYLQTKQKKLGHLLSF